MKSFISIIALGIASTAVAAPSGLDSRQFDLDCAQNSGGPSNDAKAAVVNLLKSKLPLDVGGQDGWGQDGPKFRATCQGAQIWVKHTGWEGADRGLTAEDLDETMSFFPDGSDQCGRSVDGSAGYLSILYSNEGFYDGDANFDYTC